MSEIACDGQPQEAFARRDVDLMRGEVACGGLLLKTADQRDVFPARNDAACDELLRKVGQEAVVLRWHDVAEWFAGFRPKMNRARPGGSIVKGTGSYAFRSIPVEILWWASPEIFSP